MESKRRVASTIDDNQLYRMESLTPAMMKSKEDDNLDDMMSSDIKLMNKQQYLLDGGYKVKNYFE